MPVFNIVNLHLACLLPHFLVTSLLLPLLLLLPPWHLNPLVCACACVCALYKWWYPVSHLRLCERGCRSRNGVDRTLSPSSEGGDIPRLVRRTMERVRRVHEAVCVRSLESEECVRRASQAERPRCWLLVWSCCVLMSALGVPAVEHVLGSPGQVSVRAQQLNASNPEAGYGTRLFLLSP